jgi:exonuclease SbcD
MLRDSTDGEVALYQVPFLYPMQAERVAATLSRIMDAHQSKRDGLPALVSAHLFTLGGAPSASERVFLGGAEEVPPQLFAPFAYSALGHLHSAQSAGERVHYAGSPFPYSFDKHERDKCFLEVNIELDGSALPPVSVRRVPVHTRRSVRSFSDSFDAFYSGTAYAQYADDYLEFSFTDRNLVTNPMALLKNQFPHLLSIKQEGALASCGAAASRFTKEGDGAPMTLDALFAAFMRDIHESAFDDAMLAAQSALLEKFAGRLSLDGGGA